jgi:hypothetical protein
MKTLIVITLLIISVIAYYFISSSPAHEKNQTIKSKALTSMKKEVPKISLEDTLDIKSQHVKTYHPTNAKNDYISLQDLQKVALPRRSNSTHKSYDAKIFESFSYVLKRASGRDETVVLNSKISTLLPTKTRVDNFKELLSSHFNIDKAYATELMKKKKTVWDWIHYLSK